MIPPVKSYFHIWAVDFFMSAYSQVRDAVCRIQPKALSELYSDKYSTIRKPEFPINTSGTEIDHHAQTDHFCSRRKNY